MDYAQTFTRALQALKDEGRYRVFTDIRRECGSFPSARHFSRAGARPITVWCSNDYLGMGQNPAVLAAMHAALDAAGAGSGGTRNIFGTTHYHVELEVELANLHGKEAALLFTSAYVANDTTLATLQNLLPGSQSASNALSVCSTGRLETFTHLIEGIEQHSHNRIVGIVVLQAETHPGPIVLIVALKEQLEGIGRDHQVVETGRRAGNVDELPVRGVMVGIYPASADAMYALAVEILPGRERDPEH